MTIEVDIKNLIEQFVDQAFPSIAPASTVRPYATYQQVGGQPLSFVGTDLPSLKHGRFQVNVWADLDADAAAIALQIENAFLQAVNMQAEPQGSAVATYDDEVEPPLYGRMQDFSVWSDR